MVSNDSDLATPIEMVRRELGLKVGVLNPQVNHRIAVALNRVANFSSTVQPRALAESQFPETLEDSIGKISKPPGW